MNNDFWQGAGRMIRPTLAAWLFSASTVALATSALAQTAPAGQGPVPPAAGSTGVGDIVVTAEKRSENVQKVPIAVTALSGRQLQVSRIDNGTALELLVPNMSFTRAPFGQNNFTIRGVGNQVVAPTSDSGIGVAENDAPLIVSRIADADFYDIQQVETLRGPQGTQFGRNATGGVINVLTNQPTQTLGAELTAEYGSYNERKFNGFVNVPLGDVLSFRLAGMYLGRDGFQTNALNGDKIDGRNLGSFRATVAFDPVSNFHASLMWEHFQEDDIRTNGSKTLCQDDPGPASIGGVPVGAVEQGYLSLGCARASVYSPNVFGAPNSQSGLSTWQAGLDGLISGNAFAGAAQPTNLRTVDAFMNPIYRVTDDVAQLNAQWHITPSLELTSLTGYARDNLFNRFAIEGPQPTGVFNVTAVTPGGVFSDPQIGSSNTVQTEQQWQFFAEQWSQELRLQSSFNGPINFNLGGIYIHLRQIDNFITFSNAQTAAIELGGLGMPAGVPVDTNQTPNGLAPQSLGHNYFPFIQPYTLDSKAAFGEVYWNPVSDIRVTAGLRYTDDVKDFTVYPSVFLKSSAIPFGAPGYQAYPCPGALCPFVDEGENKAVTGRFNVDWTPTLPFTDETLFYAAYSRGYKAGGFNPAAIFTATAIPYNPEFVDAFEVGTKNTALNHTLLLNLTGFYYNYTGYQISIFTSAATLTSNINAHVAGFEAEAVWEPVHNLQFNANLGLLQTAIQNGPNSTIADLVDPTNGNPNDTVVRSFSSQCVVPTSLLTPLLLQQNAGNPADSPLNLRGDPFLGKAGICGGAFAANGLTTTGASPTVVPGGIGRSIVGNQLPNAPGYTLSIGAQYRWDLSGGWSSTLHGDIYFQGPAFATFFNLPTDRLNAWQNVNLTLTFAQPSTGWQVQFYGKNILNQAAITGATTSSITFGDTTTVSVLDPATYGVSVTKRF